jgi:hypothetical protein
LNPFDLDWDGGHCLASGTHLILIVLGVVAIAPRSLVNAVAGRSSMRRMVGSSSLQSPVTDEAVAVVTR